MNALVEDHSIVDEERNPCDNPGGKLGKKGKIYIIKNEFKSCILITNYRSRRGARGLDGDTFWIFFIILVCNQ